MNGPRLTHLTLDGFHGFRSRFDDVRLLQEVLEELPHVLGLKPVMPPFLLPYYNGVVAEDCGISAFVLLAGGHLTLHTFSFRECYFADLVAPEAFDAQRAQFVLQRVLPCRTLRANVVERGAGRAEAAPASRKRAGASINPEADFGPHLFVQFAPYRGPTTLDGLFDLFDTLPPKIDMTPIMRPYVLRTHLARGGTVLSAMTMIAESHICLHVLPERGEAFFDIFSCKFFDSERVTAKIVELLGGNVREQQLVARGERYKDLRTEREEALSLSNRWLATTHPALVAGFDLDQPTTYGD